MYYGFAYDQYYPTGGANDLKTFSDDLNRCVLHLLERYGSYDRLEVWSADDIYGMSLEWSK